MSAKKLTKKAIDAADPGENRYNLWDGEVRGLHVVVYPSGGKVFYLKYRTRSGRQRRQNLGRFGSFTLQQARENARKVLADVAQGSDPAQERQEARKGATVADLCKRFMDEHAAHRKPHTAAQYRTLIDKYVLPDLGSMKVEAVTRTDIASQFHSVGKEKPVMANRLRACLHKMFELAEVWGLRPQNTNPVHGLERYKENKRHRDLTEMELTKLAKVLKESKEPPAALDAIRLLLFSGMRRGEVLGLRWADVDVDRGILNLADSKTGQKAVVLNVIALDIIKAQPRNGIHVFTLKKTDVGEAPLTESRLRHAWQRIRKAAGLEARPDGTPSFRLHDLRHNFASQGAGLGLSLPQLGALLGHRNPSTTARYAELANQPQKVAADQIGEAIQTGMKGKGK